MSISAVTKTIFFDMDGTIVNTLPWLFKAYCDVKKQLKQIPREKEFQQLNGASVQEIATALQSDTHSPSQIIEKLASARKSYLPSCATLFPGVLKFLSNCQRHGLDLWVVTSASAAAAKSILDHCNVTQMFKGYITSDGLILSKPQPEIYLKAIKIARADTKTTLVFEDSPHGITSAQAAGLNVVLFDSVSKVLLKKKDGRQILGSFAHWHAIDQWFFKEDC